LTWHDNHVGLLGDHIDWYKVNVTTHNDKLKECNGIQARAELAHCAYATHVSDVCGDHDTCYSEKVASANDYFATISALNKRLNDLCFSSAKVKCFVNLFLQAEDVKSKITMAAVKGCMDLNPDDCSNVESGTLSPKSPCDIPSPYSTLPGDDQFFATFYSVISDSSPPASIAACTKEDDADSCMCPMIHAPVCGEDGNTYSSTCAADCVGVKVFSEGECTK